MSGETWKSAVGTGHTWVFTGYLKPADHARPEPQPEGLEPVRHLVIATPSNSVKDKDKPGAQAILMSDASGLLHLMPDAAPPDAKATRVASVHYWDSSARFTIVPPEMILNAYAAHQEKWPGALKEFMTAQVSGVQESMTEMQVRKAHLRKPDPNSEDADERDYAVFYDSIPADGPPMAALVFARTRAAVLMFSDPAFKDGNVRLTSPKGKVFDATIATSPEITKPGGSSQGGGGGPAAAGLLCAVVFGSKEELPPGLYKIEVTPLASAIAPGSWRPGLKSYVLHEMLGFDISNLTGDFDVVQVDPISIEEALMLQCASQYAHRLDTAIKRVLYTEVGAPKPKFPVALEPFAERLGWAHAKTKMLIDKINDEDDGPKKLSEVYKKKHKLIGSAVYNALQAKAKGNAIGATLQGISLYYDFVEKVSGWKKTWRKLSATPAQFERVAQDLLGDKKVVALKLIRKAFVDGDETVLLKLTEAKSFKAVAPALRPKRSKIVERLGKTGRAIEKAMVVAGLAMDVVNTAVAFNKLKVAADNKEELKDVFARLVGQVDSVLHRGPSREAVGTLERMRTAAVLAELGFKEAQAEAAMAAVDLALSVLSAAGVGAIAVGIVVLAKSTYGLVVEATEWADQWILQGALEEAFAQRKELRQLYESSKANQSLVPKTLQNGGKDDLQTQFVLRAEVLTGLVRLFMRASQSTDQELTEETRAQAEQRYLANVKHYKIQEYVERFVLRDGWTFPLRPWVPLSMDSVWLYLSGEFGKASNPRDMDQVLGFSRPLNTAANVINGGMLVFAVTEAIDQRRERPALANFQATFPIHRMDAPSFDELAKAFRTSWPEVEDAAIEYTCVYVRPRGSSDDAAWKPLNQRNALDVDQLDLLSPYDQVRVLVVFKEGAQGSGCPASLQLYRTDGWNLSGPIYKELLRTLQDADLVDPATKKWAGKRTGCVFHPYFRYGHQLVPGTKPLSFTGWGLGDMRYAFELRLASRKTGPWVKLGGPNGAATKLEEFRMGLTGKPQEDLLREKDFLARECLDVEYPSIFEQPTFSRFVACYARVGGRGPWKLARLDDPEALYPGQEPRYVPGAPPTEKLGRRVFMDYDWNSTVEMVIVLTSVDVRWKVYEEQEFDWSRLPLTVDLYDCDHAANEKGPQYPCELEYVGGGDLERCARIERTPGAFGSKPPPKIPDPSPAVAEWAAQMQGAEFEALRDVVVGAYQDGTLRPRHLWAAHLSLGAIAPNGNPVKGFRPFGKVRTNKPGEKKEFYTFCLRSLATAAKIDVKAPDIRGRSIRVAQNTGCEFLFAVPAPTLGVTYPWGVMKADAEYTTWVKVYAAEKDMRVQLMHTPGAPSIPGAPKT